MELAIVAGEINRWASASASADGLEPLGGAAVYRCDLRAQFRRLLAAAGRHRVTTAPAKQIHQAAYYMTNAGGKFVVIASRGQEKKRFYYEHVRRISTEHNGFVLLIDGRDLDIIIRRTINGKSVQPHIQELFDRTIREIS